MSREIRCWDLHSRLSEQTVATNRKRGFCQTCRTLIGLDNHDCVVIQASGNPINRYICFRLLTIVIMPHFGLIDDSLQQAEASLLRARLHVRGGNIRLSEGRKEDGVAALYDAVVYAMLRFTDSSELRNKLDIKNNDNLNDDRTLFIVLKRSGIIDSSVDIEDFNYLYQIMDDAIEGKLTDFDEAIFMSKFNRLMTLLGAFPSNESDLPEEDSVTL